MINQIQTYMQNRRGRTIRVSTARCFDGTYETMVFEGHSNKPVGANGGYCERGSFIQPLHSAAVDRYWGKGFARTLETVPLIE